MLSWAGEERREELRVSRRDRRNSTGDDASRIPFLSLPRADEPKPQRITVVSATEEATTLTVLTPELWPATGEKIERVVRERLARELAAIQE